MTVMTTRTSNPPPPPPPVSTTTTTTIPSTICSEDDSSSWKKSNSILVSLVKVVMASSLLFSAAYTYSASSSLFETTNNTNNNNINSRRLSSSFEEKLGYVQPLLDELRAREKLFEETPKEEIKYWFEYAGPLQKYYYRYSKSRGKADSFEGRDDSGVVSARFYDHVGAGPDYENFFHDSEDKTSSRLLHNCQTMGSTNNNNNSNNSNDDRCHILFVMNTVGAGKGSRILWETIPPPSNMDSNKNWISEQATAATHLQRNLKEINHMCASGSIAARVQILVCEPIPGKWTDWMDAQLVDCGGKEEVELVNKDTDNNSNSNTDNTNNNNSDNNNPYSAGIDVEERPSPVQVVVVASADTADTCHNLKSGFMEKRMQDLVLAPPTTNEGDATVKTTHPDLISSDNHDLYVAFKWSSLITIRTVSSFLQSSADLMVAAAVVSNSDTTTTTTTTNNDNSHTPSSAFLIPSFVRVSYVSEENNKVAKWRMHGDFFHPAAWEVCRDSYDMTWIPNSLSNQNSKSACHSSSNNNNNSHNKDCGQWWIYMTEEQMSTTPEIFANEITPTLVRGGSNFVWMLTEQQRKQMVTRHVCVKYNNNNNNNNCGDEALAVLPLGDLESHLVNFMPNTSLGKKHEQGRRPGYSTGDQLEKDRAKVRERKQLKGQEDIEKALFDYTIYPAALFHKDATLKAARNRDSVLNTNTNTKEKSSSSSSPKSIMSDYYDVTITKPRDPLPSWCQDLARRGLCSLYAEYLRESEEQRCWEACGMKKNWTLIAKTEK